MNLEDQLRRIQRIAVNLGIGISLSQEDLDYIVPALLQVANGEDVKKAFNLPMIQGKARNKYAPGYRDKITLRKALILSEIEYYFSKYPEVSKQKIVDTIASSMNGKKIYGSHSSENTIKQIYRQRKNCNLRIKLRKYALPEVDIYTE